MMREAPLDWSEIYERLIRRPERPDPLAVAALESRVRAWTRDDELAAETCAEVVRTVNLARGGAAFEGFVQGRFIEVATSPPYHGAPSSPRPPNLLSGAERGNKDEIGWTERLSRCLEELRARNPGHHGALALLYEDRATVPEAADALAVDAWTVRSLAARAKQALAQCLERAERRRAERGGGTPGRSGGRPPRRPARPSRRR